MRDRPSVGVALRKQWDGVNKNRSRDRKMELAAPLAGGQVVSLPGGAAIFERRLRGAGFHLRDMVGVQLASSASPRG